MEEETKKKRGRPSKNESVKDVPEKIAPKRYIYRSNYDFTLNLQPGFKRLETTATGVEREVSYKGINVKFIHGRLELNDSMANHMGYPLETLVELMEKSHEWNKGFKLIHAPEKTPTAEELAWERQAEDIADGKVTRTSVGPRATDSYAK